MPKILQKAILPMAPDCELIRQRIQSRISQGEFLVSLLRIARHDSTTVQQDFVDSLSGIASGLRELLLRNGLIHQLPYAPTTYWPDQKGRRFAFIDGGVANIDLPTAAPIGIRVGSYLVRPGDESAEREKFNIELALVDDLFGGEVFDSDFEDLEKLRDVARMTSETAAAFHLLTKEGDIDALLLHGPLVNPVAPYGLRDFPPFGIEAVRNLLQDPAWAGEARDRHFIPMYQELLRKLQGTGVPVFGVVERSIGASAPVVSELLKVLQAARVLADKDADDIREKIKDYRLNDTALLDVVLGEGEYTMPQPINRQGPESKWPEDWKGEIRGYPKASTTYLKPATAVLPFRVETFEQNADHERCMELILHTSRLLPSYGFPVGLDIADKFAKVPAWMSRSVKGQHQAILIRKALQSGDPAAISFAMRVLAAKGRDWLFRPNA